MGIKEAICRFLFLKLWGWKIESGFPEGIKKSVIVVIPHTSNWDFPIGILIRPIMHFEAHYVGKSSLFFFPLGVLMRWWGGVAVDRSKNHNFVDAVADIYNHRDVFNLTVTPEGTRGKVTKLKTGFYHIAQKAKVPLVFCKFDWGTKTVGFSAPFYTTGNFEADIPKILDYFRGIQGAKPEYNFDIDAYLESLNLGKK
jgi:1-acyl-sn-glycerol-3-phosphate acyltransferase